MVVTTIQFIIGLILSLAFVGSTSVIVYKVMNDYNTWKKKKLSIIREVRPEVAEKINSLLDDITLAEQLKLIYGMHRGCRVVIDINSNGEMYISTIVKDEELSITTDQKEKLDYTG